MRGEGCFSRKYSGSKLIGTQKEDITFMQDLLDMTSGAFVTVVIAALGFNPLGAFAAGVLLGKICNIGGTVHPDGIHAISVRVLSYQRPSGPGVIGYCAAKELDFDSISLTDMEQILRAGLTHLYSFSRTMEVRTVPAEEDGEEDTAETWYIYTIRYSSASTGRCCGFQGSEDRHTPRSHLRPARARRSRSA